MHLVLSMIRTRLDSMFLILPFQASGHFEAAEASAAVDSLFSAQPQLQHHHRQHHEDVDAFSSR